MPTTFFSSVSLLWDLCSINQIVPADITLSYLKLMKYAFIRTFLNRLYALLAGPLRVIGVFIRIQR